MYADYFGLTEASFSITPDPHYLYLSPRHREALAHLIYGAGGNGGFVQLTGEVGTGKTTICRAFMEQVPEQVDLALILNPALTVVELLQAICQEFHIPLEPNESSRMTLVDKLNRYLLQAHAQGKRPVLMIDEAQNLSSEVLEQLRLLTNLETSKHKLLQIFLVGQPELQEMLQRQDLRQLAQRITARYHLAPLKEAETADYVRHRLAVAGMTRPLFSRSALRRVHRFSHGIPRLINMLCDRAMLGAFATQKHSVDAGIVKRAARELQGEQPRATHQHLWWLLLILLLCSGLYWMLQNHQPQAVAPTAAEQPVQQAPVVVTAEPAAALKPIIAEESIDTQQAEQAGESSEITIPITPEPAPETLLQQEPTATPAINIESLMLDGVSAFNQLLAIWGKPALSPTNTLCKAVTSQQLQCLMGRGSWANIRHYQRPTLLKLQLPGGSGYVLVTGLRPQTAILLHQDKEYPLPFAAVEPYWFGEFILLWQPPPSGDTLISHQSTPGTAQWLAQQLSGIQDTSDSPSLSAQIKAFQQTVGLTPDGIAGPDTLIQLNTETAGASIPRLYLAP